MLPDTLALSLLAGVLFFFVRYSGVGEDVLETEKPIFIPLAVDDKSGQRWAASLNVLFLSNNIYNFAELPGRDFTFDSCAHNTDFVTSYFWAKQSNPLFMFQKCPKKCHCCLIKLPTVKFVEKQQVELMAV
ncbi:hypothetical protein [Desulfobulbus sp.]|uniref:hypothetical protein n=1 Tax=Desulfobulbus sp. TaxID=895 RepID=UPI0027BABB8C|nr:hypothetical protein [Desulfobulbus sp.]